MQEVNSTVSFDEELRVLRACGALDILCADKLVKNELIYFLDYADEYEIYINNDDC